MITDQTCFKEDVLMLSCAQKFLEGGNEENWNIKNAESWQLPTVSDSMDVGAGQEICIFNTSSNVLMEMAPGTYFDKHCLGA